MMLASLSNSDLLVGEKAIVLTSGYYRLYQDPELLVNIYINDRKKVEVVRYYYQGWLQQEWSWLRTGHCPQIGEGNLIIIENRGYQIEISSGGEIAIKGCDEDVLGLVNSQLQQLQWIGDISLLSKENKI